MAAVPGLGGLLAHGGTAGAIVEGALVVGLAAVLLLVVGYFTFDRLRDTLAEEV